MKLLLALFVVFNLNAQEYIGPMECYVRDTDKDCKKKTVVMAFWTNRFDFVAFTKQDTLVRVFKLIERVKVTDEPPINICEEVKLKARYYIRFLGQKDGFVIFITTSTKNPSYVISSANICKKP